MEKIVEEIISYKTTFKSIDDKIFDTEIACIVHELELKLFNGYFKSEINRYFFAKLDDWTPLTIVKYINNGAFMVCFENKTISYSAIQELYRISKSDKILG